MDFFRTSTSKKSERIQQIKEQVRDLLGLLEDSTVLVTELACREQGCPPIETVIVVFRTVTQTLQLKLHKPAIEVTKEDLAQLCQNYYEFQDQEYQQQQEGRS